MYYFHYPMILKPENKEHKGHLDPDPGLQWEPYMEQSPCNGCYWVEEWHGMSLLSSPCNSPQGQELCEVKGCFH